MKIKRMVVGKLGTNCYIFENDGHVCLVDPGDDAELILSEINGLIVDKIILTHGHFDHFMASEEIKKATGVPVYVSREDSGKLSDYRESLYDIMGIGNYGFRGTKADFLVEEEIDICGEVFSVLKTTGHSSGSICLLKDKTLISGDTLFSGSIGRFDRGSYEEIMKSLTELMQLDDDIMVFPGHGEATTIGKERLTNPFIR